VHDEKRKQEIIRRFNKLAEQRETWINKNRYYYEDQARYYRFLVPEGLSVLELGCGTGDLLHALEPRRGVGVDFSGDSLRGWKDA
jgi:ubiquinone/menaquinone biosynthesis C-methylase UbiE